MFFSFSFDIFPAEVGGFEALFWMLAAMAGGGVGFAYFYGLWQFRALGWRELGPRPVDINGPLTLAHMLDLC